MIDMTEQSTDCNHTTRTRKVAHPAEAHKSAIHTCIDSTATKILVAVAVDHVMAKAPTT